MCTSLPAQTSFEQWKAQQQKEFRDYSERQKGKATVADTVRKPQEKVPDVPKTPILTEPKPVAPPVTEPKPVAPSGSFTETGGGLSFDMIGVAAGTFTMGATAEQGSEAWDLEKPTHRVTLSNYAIGKYEVTQKLWWDVMGGWPGTAPDEEPTVDFGVGNNYPMYYVSHDDVQRFLVALNTKTGKNYRLPTEAEWEYAARGGSQSKGYKYSGSNTIDDVAWWGRKNSGYNSHKVGTKAANELGIYDMSGNVWEWCSDQYDSYSSNSQTNPTGGTTSSRRVIRGGSWGNDATTDCRVSNRRSNAPDDRDYIMGFRLVLPL